MSKAVIAWLRAGGPWGTPPSVIETHAAMVFLHGSRAFKLKRSVNLGYLDFSTLEARHAALSRELELNRRTAPAFYLNVVPVVASGSSFAIGGTGAPVEWLLEMKRFPDGSLLSERLTAGTLSAALIENLARRIARFHAQAASVPGVDWAAAVFRIAQENAQDLSSQQPVFGALSVIEYLRRRNVLLNAFTNILRSQVADIRQCHGDLHLGNVFLDGDVPTLFDCVEFNAFYAQIPPLYDMAFLLMDLIARGHRELANRALNAWILEHDVTHWSAVAASLQLLPLYIALRAEIRAKTEARRPGGSDAARHYLELASKSLDAPAPKIIAVGGFSGTGKSTLARALASKIFAGTGAVHLRSDEVRKRLAGVELTTKLPNTTYTLEASARVYEKMFQLAQTCVRAGMPVVLDAVFSSADERRQIEHIAQVQGVACQSFWLEAPIDVLETRIRERQGDASDADIEVLKQQLTYDTGTITWHRLDVSGSPAEVEQAALERLQSSLPQLG